MNLCSIEYPADSYEDCCAKLFEEFDFDVENSIITIPPTPITTRVVPLDECPANAQGDVDATCAAAVAMHSDTIDEIERTERLLSYLS